MLKTVLSLIPSSKQRHLAETAGGALLFLGGRKVSGLGLVLKGTAGLEKHWREKHNFNGTWKERWDAAAKFYEETHKDDTNRKLHIVGIPIIVGGTAGLLIFPAYRPMWLLSAGAFTFGWALNFIGHGLFEKNAPAFADDPLSFIAGPIWDWQQLKGGKLKETEDGPVVDIDGEIIPVNVVSPEQVHA
jgi:hypothetical protein